MKHNTLIILVLANILFCSKLIAQNTFNKFINRSEADFGYSVYPSGHGGYVVGGRTDVESESSYLLAVTNANGDTLFTKGFPGYCGWDDIPLYAIPTYGGGYVMGPSYYNINTNSEKFCLIKTDSLGNELWNNTYTDNGIDIRACDFIQTSDSGFLLAGHSNYYGYLLKTDSAGNVQWSKKLTETGNSIIFSLIEEDNGYIISGYSDIFSSWKFFIAKINYDQNVIWYKSYSGASSEAFPLSLIKLSDSGYLISTAKYVPSKGFFEPYILKIDEVGDTIWTQTYNIFTLSYLYASAETSTGSYISVGYSENIEGNEQIYIVETTSNGEFVNDQIIIPTGYSSCAATDIQSTEDDGFIITGYCEDLSGNYGAILFKTGEDGIISSSISSESNIYLNLYPNPADNVLYIELPENSEYYKCTIYDLCGRKLYSRQDFHFRPIEINLSDFNKGPYIISISNDYFVKTLKFMIK